MSEFLFGEDLHKAIKKIAAEPGAKCAVAFWGKGCETLVAPDAQVICNLKMGGTNPYALENLATNQIRQCDTLHAKVYIGKGSAIITSANASANGLGFEAGEQSFWKEAGVRITDIAAVQTWFDNLWKTESAEIKPRDWDDAKKIWANRQRVKPSLPSFSAFDIYQPRIPFVVGSPNVDHAPVESSITEHNLPLNDVTKRRIDNGPEIEHVDDLEAMKDRWFLYWDRRLDGMPRKNGGLSWARIGNFVLPNGFIWADDPQPKDVLLEVEDIPPEPFDVSEPRFVSAFKKVITLPQFVAFRNEPPDAPWYAENEGKLRSLWAALKEQYLKE